MRYLLDFLHKYNYVFLFFLLEGVSLFMLFRFNSYQGSVWFSSANSAVARINSIYFNTLSYLKLQQVNQHLNEENIRLQSEVNALREALFTANYDSTLTERYVSKQLEGYDLIPATIVSNSLKRTNNYLVIDRGELDGVKAEMGVVGGGGIVGIVYLTGPHHSLVLPVTNRKSSISCRIRGQRYFGYLQWDGNNLLRASLDDVPRYAKIKQGEYIETSGYSSVFPPGIFVGRVCGIHNSSDGQSYKLDVQLSTDFANLRNVSVVATPYKAEIDALFEQADKDNHQ